MSSRTAWGGETPNDCRKADSEGDYSVPSPPPRTRDAGLARRDRVPKVIHCRDEMYGLSHEREHDLVVVTTQGDLTASEFFAMIGRTKELCEETGARRVLVDHSNATVGRVRHDEVRGVASFCSVLNRVLRGGRLAVVLVADIDFGLGRMWLAYSEEMLEFESALFRTRGEAEQWLLSGELNPHNERD